MRHRALSRRAFLERTSGGLAGAWLLPPWTPVASADEAVVRVDAASDLGPVSHAWSFFGHDEILWAATPNGQKLLGALGRLSPVPPYLRAHHLFTSVNDADADYATGLKFTPTNVYRERPDGTAVYDWAEIDRVFDAYVAHGVRPYVELGFMPQALSTRKEPYVMNWPELNVDEVGFSHPPSDYGKWAELVYRFTAHVAERYGREEVEAWLFQPWNEPDIGFWQGTMEAFIELYDYSADAVKRALPSATVGGPHTTGPRIDQENPKGATYLRAFLEHVTGGTNYATGKTGSPLDFIAFHTKGRPSLVEGADGGEHVQMYMRRQLLRAEKAFAIIAEFPDVAHLPIIIGESDPDSTAAYAVADRPANAYRQGALYPAYYASVYDKLHARAEHHGLRLEGNLSWAFQFEDPTLFAGYRELATGGIGKAVLNGFRLFGLMTGRRLAATSTAAVAPEEVLEESIRGAADVGVRAARDGDTLTVLVWHYHDDDVPVEPQPVRLRLGGLPPEAARRVLVEHFRVDGEHSNPYPVWQAMGSPQELTEQQRRELEEASELDLLEPPYYATPRGDALALDLMLPRPSLSLLRIGW